MSLMYYGIILTVENMDLKCYFFERLDVLTVAHNKI